MSISILDLFGEEKQIEAKVCTKCKNFLPLSDYGVSSGSNYLRAECRKCASSLKRQRKKLKLHNYPPINHICPICNRNEEECDGEGGRKNGSWCLDHDHKTGKFRGWICHNCNRALGAFKDDPELLIEALLYLIQKSDHEIYLKTLDYLEGGHRWT